MAIHPTAIVDAKAELADDVEVGPYCVIDANVKVGKGCRLYQGVYLTGWTTIGENCELHPGCVIGHSPQDVKYGGERSFCHVGNGNIIREYVTIHRGTIPESETRVGDGCFLLAGSHVAHNCILGDGVTLINNVMVAGHAIVGDKVTIGGGAGIHQFVRVGKLAMVGGMSTTRMDILPFALVDARGRIAGINRIGLRRAGVAREDIIEIREAYRTLFGSGMRWNDAVASVSDTVKTSSGKELVAFVQGDSKRGFAGQSRSNSTRNAESAE